MSSLGSTKNVLSWQGASERRRPLNWLVNAHGNTVVAFAARLTEGAVEALRQDPNVAVVEPDHIVTVAAETLPTGIDRIDAEPPAPARTRT